MDVLISLKANPAFNCLMALVLLLSPFVVWDRTPTEELPKRSKKSVPGYLITRASDGYGMTVDQQTLWLAMTSGKYFYHGVANHDDAGNHFYNGTWIPGGYILEEDAQRRLEAVKRSIQHEE